MITEKQLMNLGFSRWETNIAGNTHLDYYEHEKTGLRVKKANNGYWVEDGFGCSYVPINSIQTLAKYGIRPKKKGWSTV